MESKKKVKKKTSSRLEGQLNHDWSWWLLGIYLKKGSTDVDRKFPALFFLLSVYSSPRVSQPLSHVRENSIPFKNVFSHFDLQGFCITIYLNRKRKSDEFPFWMHIIDDETERWWVYSKPVTARFYVDHVVVLAQGLFTVFIFYGVSFSIM